MSNRFGNLFSLTTFGESHGGAVGVIVDGCPSLLPLSESEIQKELDRRRPGQSDIVTPRKEEDKVSILSGVYEGKTLGTPIAMMVWNKDQRPAAYSEMKDKYRPSHADFTWQQKFGFRNHEGGGRSSARETVARVAAGAIARKLLLQGYGVEIRSYVEAVQDIRMDNLPYFPTEAQVDQTAVRCPDTDAAQLMIERIKQVRSEGDSVGGVIACRIRGVPAGWGEPVFDRLEADLAKAMLSLPATKGFEIGSGFAGTLLKGSEHNDPFRSYNGKIRAITNRAGGVLGGISSGEEIFFRIAFKPTATILQKQSTVTIAGENTELMGRGRHDPCVLPRAVPIVEAMAALVLADQAMLHHAQSSTFDKSLFS